MIHKIKSKGPADLARIALGHLARKVSILALHRGGRPSSLTVAQSGRSAHRAGTLERAEEKWRAEGAAETRKKEDSGLCRSEPENRNPPDRARAKNPPIFLAISWRWLSALELLAEGTEEATLRTGGSPVRGRGLKP